MRRSDKRSEGFPSRLQHIVDLAGGINRCADLGGVNRRTLGNWLREVGEPTPASVERFSGQMGVDSTWLRFGTGSAPTRLAVVGPPEGIHLTPLRDPGVRSILSVDPTWVHWRLGVGPESLLLIHAPDDSMSPLIAKGDPVLGRKMGPGDGTPGGVSRFIYLVEIDGEILLRFASRKGAQFVFRPENPAYPVLEPKKFTVIGRALWTGRSLEPLQFAALYGAKSKEAP